MSTLKSLLKESLKKKAINDQTSPIKISGRLKEHFDQETIDNSSILSEEEIASVAEDCLPHMDKNDANYQLHLKAAARIKRDNPYLYNKMKNWD